MTVEEVFQRYADHGYSPALVFDDDGRWAVSDMGSSPVPDGDNGHTETVCIGSIVKPEQWKPTISEALALFVAENPLDDTRGAETVPVAAPMYRKCLYCERDMLSGSECTSAAQAGQCDMEPGRPCGVPAVDPSTDHDTRDAARYRYLRTLARRDSQPEPDGRVVLEFSMAQRVHWPVVDAAADLDCAVDEARVLGVKTCAVPFEEWCDRWLRAHPEVKMYDKAALRDAFNAGRASSGVGGTDGR